MPSWGQRSRAATVASWSASSARSKSPRMRIRVAITWPRSSRNTPATPRSNSEWCDGVMALPHVGDGPDLDAADAGVGDLGRQLEGAVEVLHVDDVVATEDLLGLNAGAVGRCRLAVA